MFHVSASKDRIAKDARTTPNHYPYLSRSSKDNNAIWVIVDYLTKVAHFILFCVGQSPEVLADKYMNEMVRLYSIPVISDRDT